MLGATIALVAALIYLSDRLTRERAQEEMEIRLAAQASHRGGELLRQLERLRRDTRFLSSTPPVQGIVRASLNGGQDTQEQNSAELWKRRLQSIFMASMVANPEIDQLRYLSAADGGRELVRVDRQGSQVTIASPEQLRPESERDYLLATSVLKPGEVHISEFMLKRQGGRLLEPMVPLLRAATPVFDSAGKLFGLVEINIDARPLLSTISDRLPDGFQAYLLNADGDFLLHPRPEATFAFERGRHHRWQDEFALRPSAKSNSPSNRWTRQVYASGDRLYHALQRDIAIDAREPQRYVTLVLAVPDRLIADRVAANRQINAALVVGVGGLAAAFLYLHLLNLRRRLQISIEQARLAAIVENSNEAIIGCTLGNVVETWNQAAEHMFGFTAAEAIGKKIDDLILPAECATEEAGVLARIAEGKTVPQYITTRHRRDGSVLHVAITASPIKAADGRVSGAAKIVRDITEQKAAENRILELNATLERQVAERTAKLQSYSALQRAILAHAGYAIIATDTAGFITLFNPAAETLLGYPAEEVVGRRTPAIFHDPAEVAQRSAALSAELGWTVTPGFETFVAKSRQVKADINEWTYIRKDGQRIPVLLNISALRDEAGQIVGYLGIAADLTERRRNEQALQDSERFIKAIADNIPGMVAYWDNELYCRFANEAYLEWFGRTPAQMRGTRLIDVLGKELYQKNEPYIRAVLRGERQVFERTLIKADGSTGYTWAHYIPDITDGIVRGFYVLVTDVTDMKRTQLRLEELNEALKVRTAEAEAASLAKSRFLANMSHEIRTPMNAILGMLQLLHHTDLTDRQADYVDKAGSAARALLGILNDILDFSKVEAGKLMLDPHPFYLDNLLRDIGVILSANLGNKPVELLFDIDASAPKRVIGDALRLQQVLINLAGNAIKFTDRGEVVLSVQVNHLADQRISLTFAVRDTGIGISRERCQHIFEGFSQAEASTTRRYGGTGLGLAISQRLVHLMGGQLSVESELGRGSVFRFTIDLALAESGNEPLPAAPADLHGLRTLVVDDNASSRDVMANMVSSLGWQVDVAINGEDALVRVREANAAGRPYQVVLVDWMMPGIDGWETSERIRALPGQPAAPLIVMVTAHGREALARRLTDEPRLLDGFLVKPVTASMLLDAVADARPGHAPIGQTERPSGGAAQRLSGLRLLVVEDNPTNQQVARELLTSVGATVAVASGGLMAVEAVRRANPPFDAVLMDIQMPDMDGFAATREIRGLQDSLSLPIIAMTANAMPADREASLAAGMDDHVGKPFDLEHLVSVIQKHTGRSSPAGAAPDIQHSNAANVAATIVAAVADAPKPPAAPIIDHETALLRFGSIATIYRNALESFAPEANQLWAQCLTHLQELHWDDAKRTLHSLKGIAATVGADRLAALAAQAELAIVHAASQAPPDLPTKLIETELGLAIAEARRLAPQFTESPEMEPAATAPVPDEASLRQQLAALKSLLEANNLQATAAINQVRQQAPGQAFPEFDSLEHAIRRLDFKTAAACCDQLLQRLQR